MATIIVMFNCKDTKSFELYVLFRCFFLWKAPFLQNKQGVVKNVLFLAHYLQDDWQITKIQNIQLCKKVISG
jgi:hypothetical protein